jgi:CRP-like cAMP-binding protein
MLAISRKVNFGRGETLFRDGDPPGGMYGVITGGIGVMLGPPRTSPRLGHILRSGDWFGASPILSCGVRVLGFEAVEPSALLLIPLNSLQDAARDNVDIMRRLGSHADRAVVLAAAVASDLLIQQSARRVAAVLMRITAAEEGVRPDHPDGFMMSQTMLAEMCNVSRNYVNRVLSQLKRNGWIATNYNHVSIINVPALLEFAYANGECSGFIGLGIESCGTRDWRSSYRVTYVDYASGNGNSRFVYDTVTFGPTLGLEFRF